MSVSDPGDAQAPGGWRRQGERGSAAGAALVRWLTAWLPRRVAHLLIPPVAWYFLATHRPARQCVGRAI